MQHHARGAEPRARIAREEPMSDKVYDVPAEWAKRAWVNAGQVR